MQVAPLGRQFSRIELESRGKSKVLPKKPDAFDRFRIGARGRAKDEFGGVVFDRLGGGRPGDCPVARGQVAGFHNNGNAFVRSVGARSQVGDGEARGGRGQDGARRRHAVKQAEYFEFGFELVRDAIDGEVRLADGFFDGGDEVNHRQRGWAEFLSQCFARVVQIGGHHVFKQHGVARASSGEREPPAQRACSDDCDRCQLCGLLDGKGFRHIFCVGLGVLQVLGDAGAFLRSKCGHKCEHSAQGYSNVVNVIHQADSFSGERHGGPRY